MGAAVRGTNSTGSVKSRDGTWDGDMNSSSSSGSQSSMRPAAVARSADISLLSRCARSAASSSRSSLNERPSDGPLLTTGPPPMVAAIIGSDAATDAASLLAALACISRTTTCAATSHSSVKERPSNAPWLASGRGLRSSASDPSSYWAKSSSSALNELAENERGRPGPSPAGGVETVGTRGIPAIGSLTDTDATAARTGTTEGAGATAS
mmetsp:Transcript_43156/g.103461  ORF Transcript_43156/g.103461 Transcript_43156/m.103461 type:complete len:210 (-) Transcript_43156:715-1344(-)